MKQRKTQLGFLLFFSLLFQLSAQEATLSTGGEATSNTGSVSYSIGQVLYQTFTSAEHSEAQGVQQAYEISVITSTPSLETAFNISVAPNPTIDFLTLQVNDLSNQTLFYQLFNQQGQLLSSQELTSAQTKVSTQFLPPTVYFLKISQQGKVIQTFKIIKY